MWGMMEKEGALPIEDRIKDEVIKNLSIDIQAGGLIGTDSVTVSLYWGEELISEMRQRVYTGVF